MNATNNTNETARQQLCEIRASVEKSSDQATGRRTCPNCRQSVILHHGKASGKWFYKHEREQDCIYDGIGTSIFFNTRDEALRAEEIFHE